jgi:hypothetical protein
MNGRLHAYIFNMPRLFVPRVIINLRIPTAKVDFYRMSTENNTNTFKFFEAILKFNRVRLNPDLLTAHHSALSKGGVMRLKFTRVELGALTFGKGTKFLTLDNVIIGMNSERIIFKMIKDSEFIGSTESNPFNFQQHKITYFTRTSSDFKTLAGVMSGHGS